ncbi:O-antigen ligase family protein [Acidovorax sp. 1608163]|uniref:O-antigen ligase family protein n=1 Tax=Acidovorax sp. 1608163 TaxID=2478662 RepID=UPI000EF6FEF1|nr:O-antigen ligase family protein [Acidovorax sp. 1608163]AYM98078.1 O-antigen ligase family protein [Acidovorax sp. 1608163]
MQYPHVFLRSAAVFSAIAAFFSIPWTLAGANISLLCLVLAWLLAGDWRQRWDAARGNAVSLPLLVLYAIILLGAVYTTAPWRVVLDHWLKYDKLLLMVIAISLLAQDEKTRERCWTAFTIAALFTLASSYLSIWWRLPWSRAQTLGWGGDHSVFKDYITQSVLMALLMLRGLYLALRANVAWQRGAWLAVAALAFVCNTQLLYGRTGYVATAVAVLAFVLALVPVRRWWMALALVAVLLAGAVLLSPTIVPRVALGLKELGEVPETTTSIGPRLYFLHYGLDLFWQKPWLGWGTGAYHGEFCRIATTPEWCAAGSFHPHNQFLFFMIEHGIPGLLAFAAVFAAALWQAARMERLDRAVAFAFVGVACVGSLTHSGIWLANEGLAYSFGLVLVLTAPLRPCAKAQAGVLA